MANMHSVCLGILHHSLIYCDYLRWGRWQIEWRLQRITLFQRSEMVLSACDPVLVFLIPTELQKCNNRLVNRNYKPLSYFHIIISPPFFTYEAEDTHTRTFICSSQGNELNFCPQTACFLFVAQYKG